MAEDEFKDLKKKLAGKEIELEIARTELAIEETKQKIASIKSPTLVSQPEEAEEETEQEETEEAEQESSA